MRPRGLDAHVGDLEHGDLADAKATADSEAEDDEVLLRGRGARSLAFQIREHRAQFAACENLGGIDSAVRLYYGEVPGRRAGLLLARGLIGYGLSQYLGFRSKASKLGPSSRILGPIRVAQSHDAYIEVHTEVRRSFFVVAKTLCFRPLRSYW